MRIGNKGRLPSLLLSFVSPVSLAFGLAGIGDFSCPVRSVGRLFFPSDKKMIYLVSEVVPILLICDLFLFTDNSDSSNLILSAKYSLIHCSQELPSELANVHPDSVIHVSDFLSSLLATD